MKKMSSANKIKSGRGSGFGSDYDAFIHGREFNSTGTCSQPIDPITKRQVYLLSQGEQRLYYILRWNDHVTDIREQYPLDPNVTKTLAKKCGLPHPCKEGEIMTTDFLVDYDDGHQMAINFKSWGKKTSFKSALLQAFETLVYHLMY
ncbi:MAG: TnsA endonuclease N-terminal domain-containing protein, partial [Erysipelotrichaceae bacterium]|nr:TnsA endonuclease N-terminal domain-containing protein [Erysipelotrichaceae bacterium]